MTKVQLLICVFPFLILSYRFHYLVFCFFLPLTSLLSFAILCWYMPVNSCWNSKWNCYLSFPICLVYFFFVFFLDNSFNHSVDLIYIFDQLLSVPVNISCHILVLSLTNEADDRSKDHGGCDLLIISQVMVKLKIKVSSHVLWFSQKTSDSNDQILIKYWKKNYLKAAENDWK